MTLTVSEFLGAAGGGALGAALGALLAFSMMGAVVVVCAVAAAVSASSTLLGDLALGPVLGPHVTFAGGVAAAAYAAHKGLHESGRDIALPLVVYDRAAILGIGAIFGVLGQFIARMVGEIPALHDSAGEAIAVTDSLAVSVVVTALVAAALWGRHRFEPAKRQTWLAWQHSPLQVIVMGAAAGTAAGAVYLAWPEESAGSAGAFVYGLSALSLLALVFGKAVPVTHHITLPAVLAAGVVAGHDVSDSWVLLAAIGAGVAGSVLAEAWARLCHERSPVHLDPPAFAIAAMATALALIRLGLG